MTRRTHLWESLAVGATEAGRAVAKSWLPTLMTTVGGSTDRTASGTIQTKADLIDGWGGDGLPQEASQ
jgi:hypothetical protein